jgi:type II secretory pathway pseudopilin PulG
MWKRRNIPRQCAGAFTLVEATMSTLIVSILLVCAVQVAGANGLAQYKSAERSTARFLADGLLNDISALPYEDPNLTPLFGRESGETAASKANYDDIDDFDGWSESPPQYRDGSQIPNLTGWRRTVKIERLGPNDLSVQSIETGAKRITVTILHNNVTVLSRAVIRTRAS